MKPDYSYQPGLIAEVQKYYAAGEPIVVLAGAPCAGKTRMACELIIEHLRTTNTDVVVLTEGQTFLRQQFARASEGSFIFGTLSQESPIVGPERVHIALPHNLRTQGYVWPRKVGLLVVDEAHNFYPTLDGMVAQFVAKVQPTQQLLLTGTPSHFIKKKLPIVAISLLELIDFGVASDIKSVIATTNHYRFTRKDYSKAQELKETVVLLQDQTISVLNDLLMEVHRRLLSITRAFPEYHQHLKGVAPSWPLVLSRLKKTMFVCHSQDQAQDVLKYFLNQSVNVVTSTSFYDYDAVEIDKFVNDPEVRVLVVVKRCTLGFDFAELASVIDLTGSLNPNVLFQLMCRLTRPNRRSKKLFLKVCPESLWDITYLTMSFVVALADMRYYMSYSGGRYRDRIPIPKRGLGLLERKRNRLPRPPQKLPELLTFTMLKAYRDGTVYGEKAYTTFARMRLLLNGQVPPEDYMELVVAYGTQKWKETRDRFAKRFL